MYGFLNMKFNPFLIGLGIRILYTNHLRQHDTGMILIGTEVNFLHIIPPLQKSFLSLGRCTSDCTSKVNLKALTTIFGDGKI